MNLKQAVKASRIPYRKLGAAVGLSAASITRLVNDNEYPSKKDAGVVLSSILRELAKHGIETQHIQFPAVALQSVNESQEEDTTLMQLDRETLALFGLRSDPFINDIETDDDVLVTPGYKQIEQALTDTVEQRGFLALIGPSGAGKTTLWDGVESAMIGRDDVVICKPQIMSKEKLSPEHLSRALIYGLCGDDTRVKQDAEDRGRQLSQALAAIRTSGRDRKAVLYIDDAHFANTAVLRQLKSFYEQKIGRYRLLAIVLVGLESLKNKLGHFAEVGNRIRVVEVPPVPVEAYVQHKLQRVGSSIDKMFEPDAWKALKDRFGRGKRVPTGYPLLINATLIRCMNKARENEMARGERISVGIIDQLPGVASIADAAARKAVA
jgi:type II secretory pathway predicted ATPase ExeA